jgi:acyl dehydratase
VSALAGRSIFFDDLRVGEVRELGSHVFTKEEIIEFAERWDPHLWHVDEEAAEASFFGGIVSSGVHTFAAFTKLLTSNFLLDVAVTAGKDINIQMRSPVRAGEEIHARVTIAALEDVPRRDDQGLAHLEGECYRDDGSVVLAVRIQVLVARRPAGAGESATEGQQVDDGRAAQPGRPPV